MCTHYTHIFPIGTDNRYSSFWNPLNKPATEDLEPRLQPSSEAELPPIPRLNSSRTWVGLLRPLAPPPPNPDWLEEEIGPTISPFLKGRSRVAFLSGRRRPNRTEEIRVGPRPAEPRLRAQVAGRAPPSGQAEPKMLASATLPLLGSLPPPASPFPLLLLAVLTGPVSGRVPRSVPRTSLPISGKAWAPPPSALRPAPGPRLQVPAPTCSAYGPGQAQWGPAPQRTASRAAHAPPGPRRDPHAVLPHRIAPLLRASAPKTRPGGSRGPLLAEPKEG